MAHGGEGPVRPASTAGAIVSAASDFVDIADSRFANNSAVQRGGAVMARFSSIAVSDSVFEDGQLCCYTRPCINCVSRMHRYRNPYADDPLLDLTNKCVLL